MSTDILKPGNFRTLVTQTTDSLTLQVISGRKVPDIESGTEPWAPVTKKGILTSFQNGKPMNIPDGDLVSLPAHFETSKTCDCLL